MARWFAMFEGTVTDTRLKVIAKRLTLPLSAVVAAWLYTLETASNAVDRGSVAAVNAEEMDCLLDLGGENTARLIIQGFEDRGMTAGGRVADWDEKQPKSDAERKRLSRNKRDLSQNVTDGHGNVRNVTDREREIKKETEIDIPPIAPQGGGEGATSFQEFWKARPDTGGAPDSEKAARQQWDKAITAGATPDRLLKGMQGYAAWVDGARAIGKKHFCSTAEFLRSELWAQYADAPDSSTAGDTGADLPDWQQPLLTQLKPHEVRTFFKHAEFDGKEISVEKKFTADWIKNHFGQAIEKVLGKVSVSVRGAA